MQWVSELQTNLTARPRGRVLAISRCAPVNYRQMATNQERSSLFQVSVLVFALTMFTQCFQYMTDIPPLYLLSKVWPFLVLPIAAWAMMRLELPNKVLHVSLLLWLIGVTPLLGVLNFGNTIADALATTVKIWSFTYVFAVAGVLVLLGLSHRIMQRVIVGMGIATFAIMSLLWVAVPVSAYGGGDLDTKLFMVDVERGYRIYMPMYFGVLLVFHLNRSAWQRFAWWKVAGIAFSLLLMLTVYKQRAAIASTILALVIGGVLSLRRWRIAAIAALTVAGCAAAILFMAQAQNAVALKSNLGASLAVREVSVNTAWNYLSANPERWVLGIGGTTRLGDVTLGKLFNNPMFFLADIGWLGVLFEYGAIGVGLMLLVYCAGLKATRGWERPDDALSQALGDYIIYLLAASIVYSAVFTPGELTTTIALSYYRGRVRQQVQGIGRSQASAVNPLQMACAMSLPVGLVRGPPSGMAKSE